MKEAAYTYFLQANTAIAFSVLMYLIFLRKEHAFNLQRKILLGLLLLSAIIPLVQFNLPENTLPTLSRFLQAYTLPEITITGGLSQGSQPVYTETSRGFTFPALAEAVYFTGAGILLLLFLIRLGKLLNLLRNSPVRNRAGSFVIIESEKEVSDFSFWHYLFIGRIHRLSKAEKSHIITHELAHASSYHTADILFIELLKIVFWFNPFIYIARNLLTAIHEFQADQLTIQHHHTEDYCHLLARSALADTNSVLVSHFNKSLTLKRIAMIKSAKRKTSGWKLAFVLPLITLGLAIVACQDQAMKEVMNTHKTLSQVNESDIPAELQGEVNKIRQKDPDARFTYIEGEQKEVSDLVEKYGDTKKPLAILANPKKGTTGILLLDISSYAEAMKNPDNVYSVVEEAASPVGGMGELMKFIGDNLKYPAEARAASIQGKVFVQFVVQEDGSVAEVELLRGIGGGCDEEAMRVIAATKWNPGKQRGAAIKQRMSIPIQFSLGEAGEATGNKTSNTSSTAPQLSQVESLMKIESKKTESNGLTYVEGTIRNTKGEPLAGTNVILMGTTRGTVADATGKFKLQVDKPDNKVVFSFVGYQTQVISL
jgi:TonB family protein